MSPSVLLCWCAALVAKAFNRRWQLHLRIDMCDVGNLADVVILVIKEGFDRYLRSGYPMCSCSAEAHVRKLVVSAMRLGARIAVMSMGVFGCTSARLRKNRNLGYLAQIGE